MEDASYDRSWNKGIFTFIDKILFRRILQDSSCRQELDAAVEDLYVNYLTEEAVQEKINTYRAATEEYLYSLPDQTYVPVSQEEYDILSDSMADEIADNYNMYKETMASAWPFHIKDPVNENGSTVFSWEESYVFEGASAVYTVEVAADYTFEDCIVNEQTDKTEYRTEQLPAGQYFVRIRASGENGISQDAYEYYNTEKGTASYSTLCFYILEDGTAAASRFGEDE